MDIITAAIAGALGNLGAATVLHNFNALKEVVQRKFGAASKLYKALMELEEEPDSKGRALVFEEEMQRTKADKDADLIKAAEELLAEVKKQPGGEAFVQQIVNQQVTGDNNVFSGTGDVNVNR
ncbi:hypothetical protein VU04_01125 [Desulfobulbus sp. TB]|nr:hypothetical protein [Desulfobulbus sp. TB]